MNNLTIRAKLYGAFGLLLLLIVALGAVSLNRIGALNTEAVDIRDNWLPSVGTVGRLATLSERTRVYEVRLALAKGDAVPEAKRILLSKVAETDKIKTDYAPLVSKGTDDERLQREFVSLWEEHKVYINKLIALVEAGETDKSWALFAGPGLASMDKIRATLSDEVRFNQEEGEKAGQLGERVYQQTKEIIYTAIVISIVLTFFLSFIIIQNVSVPVTQMTSAMRKLG